MRHTYYMSSLIFCAHTDDAIFSLGDYIIENNDNNFTIAAAFAGIPKDDAGNKKHTTLRQEHADACSLINVKYINGDLLDDVYGKQNEYDLVDWIKDIVKDFDNIYIPLGIHHPDHILLSETLLNLIDSLNKTYFIYAELPYRVAYPELYEFRFNKFKSIHNLENISINFTKNKVDAIHKYNSQIALVSNKTIIDENLIENLVVEEKLWKVLS